MSEPLRLGTRGSPLALRQAGMVADAIDGEVELVVVRTAGDAGAGADKRRWVDTIEDALLAGEIDLAVHSAKDLPGLLAQGLEIAGCPARADPRDALCGAAALRALAPGATVGTSSLRRAAQLRALREDLSVVELHGNLDTRLRRLADGDYDAIVLARAGLARLGRDGGAVLDEMVPAAGQGTLAIEARGGDARVARAIAGLRDLATERALSAERTLVTRLGAGCDTPIGAYAYASAGTGGGDGRGGHGGHDGALELRTFVGSADGSFWIRDALAGSEPVALGETVAERLLAAGAGALLP